jgi:hypothetical protein
MKVEIDLLTLVALVAVGQKVLELGVTMDEITQATAGAAQKLVASGFFTKQNYIDALAESELEGVDWDELLDE